MPKIKCKKREKVLNDKRKRDITGETLVLEPWWGMSKRNNLKKNGESG